MVEPHTLWHRVAIASLITILCAPTVATAQYRPDQPQGLDSAQFNRPQDVYPEPVPFPGLALPGLGTAAQQEEAT